jgi:RNA polymerase-binding transcription factor DksA
MANLLNDTNKLVKERERTQAYLAHLKEALKADADSIVDPDDPNLKDHEMVVTQIKILENELLWLDEAIQRMQQGTYGLCKRCGQPIEPGRLEVLPETTLCINCRTDFEFQLRMRAAVTA